MDSLGLLRFYLCVFACGGHSPPLSIATIIVGGSSMLLTTIARPFHLELHTQKLQLDS